MRETIKLSLALTLVCGLAAAVLGMANEATRKACKAAESRKAQELLRLVLPSFDNDPLAEAVTVEADGATAVFYPARLDGKFIGCAGSGQSQTGFGGLVKVLVGITPEGVISNVLVAEHKETPGLGSVVTDRKESKSLYSLFRKPAPAATADSAKLPPNRYLDQFSGRSLLQAAPFQFGTASAGIAPAANPYLDAVSGATISSKAVAKAVNMTAAAFKANHENIKGTGK